MAVSNSRPRIFKKKTLSCRNCGDASEVLTDDVEGIRLCSGCGLVLEDKLISEQQEWRNFNTESLGAAHAEKSRVGEFNDVWLDDVGNSTTFIGGSKKMQQLQSLMGNYDSSDRILRNAYSLLRGVGDSLDIKDHVTERCKEILKDMHEASILKGRCTILNILAIIYLGCRECGISRSLRELCIYDRNISPRDLGRAINRLKKQLPNRGNAPVEDTMQILPRYTSKLNLSTHIANICENVCSQATMLLRSSHRTTSLAAAIIYFVTQTMMPGQISIADIALVCGTSVNTIKVTHKELMDIKDKLLNKLVQ
ncbi:transcription initiation factor iib, putative [Theileria equi strain WA]|uniref:General transcription factor TFIIB n=1 Tax=Theileria equi strain WA TaxID=1537102 RepID=L0AVL9_THEEQ|nr:transcription initiation factor iib, putative [Theileria equi strain WA]AFZ79071.1 transcription initiation factor iib, putative [Theileria equi strain WA]|eukprot:XP_004828737.1 transcription initiation factor iib, putative [Theileria equi strain WA]